MAKRGLMPPAYRRWRETWVDRMDSPWVRFFAWFDLIWVDHGFLRPFFNRPEEIAPGVFRSNQPSPWRIRSLQKRGLKSIINVRGVKKGGYFLLEKEACKQHGIELFNPRLYSRRLPTPAEIRRIQAIFEQAPKPTLIHCKSGADRAGLASALYLLLCTNSTPEQALDHLSMRYLHLKHAKTGVLDHGLEQYARENAKQPIPFSEWIDQKSYDPEAFKTEFKPKGWANWIVDRLLKRE